MSEIFPRPKVEIKTIGIYLYDGYSALDAMGPYSVFTRLMGSNVFSNTLPVFVRVRGY